MALPGSCLEEEAGTGMGAGAQSWTMTLKATLKRGENALLVLGAIVQACKWSLWFLAKVGNG